MTQKVYLLKKAIFIYQKEVFFVMLSPSEEAEWFDAESFDAEIPKSVKMGFGFATGLALFQVAVIAGAVGIGMLMKKDE